MPLSKTCREVMPCSKNLAPVDGNCDHLSKLISSTIEEQQHVVTQLSEGRDRLLELNSNRPEEAADLVESIREIDKSSELEEFMLEVFDHYGVRVEDFRKHTYLLDGRGVTTESFPGLPKDGLVATFDRALALGREDIALLTSDHPIVTGAMDLLLGSEQGNCSFGLCRDPHEKELFIEAIFVVETLAPTVLHADRYLPPTPLRVVVNQAKERVSLDCSDLEDGSPRKLLENGMVRGQLIPRMLKAAQSIAEEDSKDLIAECNQMMSIELRNEVNRLSSLRKVNDHIRMEEIDLLREQFQQLEEAIEESRVRLDAFRLIWKGLPEDLDGM